MEDTTAAISAIAAGIESASSATSDASTASSASNDTATSATGDSNPTGAVDIPSGDPAAEEAAPEVPLEVAEETQDPNEPQGHMPLHRHKAVLTKARNEAKAAQDALNAQLESLKWAQAPGITDKLQALDIAEADPDRFIQVLKQDPRYARLLTPAEQPAQPAAPPAQPAYGDRPGPDMQDEAGNTYYSGQQAAALQEWLEQANDAKVQALLDKRFAPLEAERKEAAERKQQEMEWKGAIDRQRTILTDARATWPLFSEVENSIKADLAKNPTMTLETAYRRAFTPRAQANRDEMRKSILAELNNRPPVAASTRPGSAPAKPPVAEQDVEAQIMAIARNLERSA